MPAGCFHDIDLTPNRIEEARRRRAAGRGYHDLTSSNPTHQGLLFPPDVLRSAADAYWEQRRYTPNPRGSEPARVAIAHTYAARLAQTSPPTATPYAPTPADIFITASTSEAYSLLFALLTTPGDNVLAPNVSYPLFEYLAAIHHITLRPYALDESRHWQIDAASLLAQADEYTRAVLIVSPHNPTGAVLHTPLPALETLALPLLCDEVFAAFPYRLATVPPLATLHPHQPIFHLNGISKHLALPDMKLGWIALNPPASAAYGERLELLNDTFLGASGLIQAMLPALFAHSTPFVDTMRQRIHANLSRAIAALATHPRYTVVPPDGGYYLFPAVEGWPDEEELVLHLLDQGVLVHPGYFYGDPPGPHIMLSALTEPATFTAGLEILCAL